MPQHPKVVYFAHGKESGPWGIKIIALAKIARKKRFAVESPDYSFTMDPEERVKKLFSLNPRAQRDLVLVGSSMGGYISTVASKKLKPSGLFLLAPAFYIIEKRVPATKSPAIRQTHRDCSRLAG